MQLGEFIGPPLRERWLEGMNSGFVNMIPPDFILTIAILYFIPMPSGGEMLREDRFERAISLLAGSLSSMQGNGIPCIFDR